MLTGDESAELAELRRRAWGVDADIDDDPVALARLQELEARAEHPLRDEAAGALREAEPPARSTDDPGVPAETPARSPREAEAHPAISDDPGTPDHRSSPSRRTVVFTVAATVIVLAAVAGSILQHLPASPHASTPSPTAPPPPIIRVSALPPLACGDGWGPAATGRTPEGEPVWSRVFDERQPTVKIAPTNGAMKYAVRANFDVRADTISDVTVVKPDSARLFFVDTKTWARPPSPDQIVVNGATAIALPLCSADDSYPGYVMTDAPACVTLEFTVNGIVHYTADTQVGSGEGARCPKS